MLCNGQFISSQNASIEKKALHNVNYRTEAAKKFPLMHALKKSLIFLEQQDNVDFKTEDLTAVRRLINQITLHHLSLLRQTSIELFLQ